MVNNKSSQLKPRGNYSGNERGNYSGNAGGKFTVYSGHTRGNADENDDDSDTPNPENVNNLPQYYSVPDHPRWVYEQLPDVVYDTIIEFFSEEKCGIIFGKKNKLKSVLKKKEIIKQGKVIETPGGPSDSDKTGNAEENDDESDGYDEADDDDEEEPNECDNDERKDEIEEQEPETPGNFSDSASCTPTISNKIIDISTHVHNNKWKLHFTKNKELICSLFGLNPQWSEMPSKQIINSYLANHYINIETKLISGHYVLLPFYVYYNIKVTLDSLLFLDSEFTAIKSMSSSSQKIITRYRLKNVKKKGVKKFKYKSIVEMNWQFIHLVNEYLIPLCKLIQQGFRNEKMDKLWTLFRKKYYWYTQIYWGNFNNEKFRYYSYYLLHHYSDSSGNSIGSRFRTLSTYTIKTRKYYITNVLLGMWYILIPNSCFENIPLTEIFDWAMAKNLINGFNVIDQLTSLTDFFIKWSWHYTSNTTEPEYTRVLNRSLSNFKWAIINRVNIHGSNKYKIGYECSTIPYSLRIWKAPHLHQIQYETQRREFRSLRLLNDLKRSSVINGIVSVFLEHINFKANPFIIHTGPRWKKRR